MKIELIIDDLCEVEAQDMGTEFADNAVLLSRFFDGIVLGCTGSQRTTATVKEALRESKAIEVFRHLIRQIDGEYL